MVPKVTRDSSTGALGGPLRQQLFNPLGRVQALLHEPAEPNSSGCPAVRRDDLKVHQGRFEGVLQDLPPARGKEVRQHAHEAANGQPSRVEGAHRGRERTAQQPSSFRDGSTHGSGYSRQT